MRRLLIMSALAAIVVAGSVPAYAGGWAVGTLDDAAPALRAGEAHEVGYTIRQHGQTPIALEGTAIRVRSLATGDVHTFAGKPAGAVGHHVAVVQLPTAGDWSWELDLAGFGPQPLGTITVSGPATAANATTPVTTSTPDAPAWRRIGLPILAGVALAVFAAQLLALRRRRDPLVTAR